MKLSTAKRIQWIFAHLVTSGIFACETSYLEAPRTLSKPKAHDGCTRHENGRHLGGRDGRHDSAQEGSRAASIHPLREVACGPSGQRGFFRAARSCSAPHACDQLDSARTSSLSAHATHASAVHTRGPGRSCRRALFSDAWVCSDLSRRPLEYETLVGAALALTAIGLSRAKWALDCPHGALSALIATGSRTQAGGSVGATRGSVILRIQLGVDCCRQFGQ